MLKNFLGDLLLRQGRPAGTASSTPGAGLIRPPVNLKSFNQREKLVLRKWTFLDF